MSTVTPGTRKSANSKWEAWWPVLAKLALAGGATGLASRLALEVAGRSQPTMLDLAEAMSTADLDRMDLPLPQQLLAEEQQRKQKREQLLRSVREALPKPLQAAGKVVGNAVLGGMDTVRRGVATLAGLDEEEKTAAHREKARRLAYTLAEMTNGELSPGILKTAGALSRMLGDELGMPAVALVSLGSLAAGYYGADALMKALRRRESAWDVEAARRRYLQELLENYKRVRGIGTEKKAFLLSLLRGTDVGDRIDALYRSIWGGDLWNRYKGVVNTLSALALLGGGVYGYSKSRQSALTEERLKDMLKKHQLNELQAQLGLRATPLVSNEG